MKNLLFPRKDLNSLVSADLSRQSFVQRRTLTYF